MPILNRSKTLIAIAAELLKMLIRGVKRPLAELLRSSCDPPECPHHQAFDGLHGVWHRRTHVHERRTGFHACLRRFYAVQMARQGRKKL
ncbi:hypothetical protein [Pseudomonas sp. P42]|uniref:hypothetical protein n=1 Tax=Pseudomonas sp. P42 TaxID=1080160 RepID=UPI001B329405|nr:hypothetical protein [Pseudomonas sp. P42]MBP5950585.1 hypothetical protein [Pseudomonas sp. P42]